MSGQGASSAIRHAKLLGVSGDFFGEDFFGHEWFDRHLSDEPLAFSIDVGRHTLFLLASTFQERELWVAGINAIVSGQAQPDQPEMVQSAQFIHALPEAVKVQISAVLRDDRDSDRRSSRLSGRLSARRNSFRSEQVDGASEGGVNATRRGWFGGSRRALRKQESRTPDGTPRSGLTPDGTPRSGLTPRQGSKIRLFRSFEELPRLPAAPKSPNRQQVALDARRNRWQTGRKRPSSGSFAVAEESSSAGAKRLAAGVARLRNKRSVLMSASMSAPETVPVPIAPPLRSETLPTKVLSPRADPPSEGTPEAEAATVPSLACSASAPPAGSSAAPPVPEMGGIGLSIRRATSGTDVEDSQRGSPRTGLRRTVSFADSSPSPRPKQQQLQEQESPPPPPPLLEMRVSSQVLLTISEQNSQSTPSVAETSEPANSDGQGEQQDPQKQAHSNALAQLSLLGTEHRAMRTALQDVTARLDANVRTISHLQELVGRGVQAS